MTESIPKSMTPQQTEAARQRVLHDAMVPFVRRIFERHPDLRSAMLMVAQYWNDEADDAVHWELAFSVHDEPNLEAARAEDEYEIDEHNLPGRSPADLLDGSYEHLPRWDDNGSAVSLFAAYCREDCHQEMEYLEAFAPYALFRRGDDGSIEVTVVGEMIRPWLDGVTPQWHRPR